MTTKTPKKKTGLAGADEQHLTAMIRAGAMSWTAIGAHFGVSSAAVLQWAKRRGIQRGEIASDIRAATRAAVSGASFAEVAAGVALAEPVVAAAAMANMVIIGQHRDDLNKLRKVHDMGLAKLEALVDNPEAPFKDLGAAMKFFGAMESATRTTRHLIEKERQAHGISDDSDPDDDGVVQVTIKSYRRES